MPQTQGTGSPGPGPGNQNKGIDDTTDSLTYWAQRLQDFFTNIVTTVINIGTIRTTNYDINEDVDGTRPIIYIQPNNGNKRGMLEIAPSGTSTVTQIVLYGNSSADGTEVLSIQEFAGGVEMDFTSADLSSGVIFQITGTSGAKAWVMGQNGSLTLPGNLINTAIADPSAAAGQFWLSSTNVDNLKYSSASTIYTLTSTKSSTNNATAAAPSGTTSATAVMMACGGAITPANTGRVLITASGQMANTNAGSGATIDLRYGTGTAPANGDAVTGTLVGIAQTNTSVSAAQKSGFCVSGIITGLTLGTAYWIDLSLLKVTAGTATITGVTISAVEV